MEPFFEEGVHMNNLRDTTAPRNRWQPGFLRPEHPIHPSVRSSTLAVRLHSKLRRLIVLREPAAPSSRRSSQKTRQKSAARPAAPAGRCEPKIALKDDPIAQGLPVQATEKPGCSGRGGKAQRSPGFTIDQIVVPRRAGTNTPNGVS